ncbi:unnamed protein product [Brassica oleracea]
MGIKFDDEIHGLWLLGTLPDSWEVFRIVCVCVYKMKNHFLSISLFSLEAAPLELV